jgi:hypothetical protein
MPGRPDRPLAIARDKDRQESSQDGSPPCRGMQVGSGKWEVARSTGDRQLGRLEKHQRGGWRVESGEWRVERESGEWRVRGTLDGCTEASELHQLCPRTLYRAHGAEQQPLRTRTSWYPTRPCIRVHAVQRTARVMARRWPRPRDWDRVWKPDSTAVPPQSCAGLCTVNARRICDDQVPPT